LAVTVIAYPTRRSSDLSGHGSMRFGRRHAMAVTIYDVAEAAGVSIATVSKALNDSYTIPETTKEAIRATAERLGYRPNARAKNLDRKSTRLNSSHVSIS